MKVIGITGGIGSGKSTVSGYLREKHYEIIDADEISRGLTADGSPMVDTLAAEFGREILIRDGVLDRKKLAEIVFHDPEKNARLQQLVTARVGEICREKIEQFRSEGAESVVFLDVPLLYETGSEVMCDRVWYVTADEETRIRRVMARDGADREQVKARMRSQMPEEEKRRRADDVIDNSGSLEQTHARIGALLQEQCGNGLTN